MDGEARIEAGTLPDGRLAHLVAVRAAGRTAAAAVIRLPAGEAPDGAILLHAVGLFPAGPFDAALGDLVDALTPSRLHEQDLHDLSLFHRDRAERLAEALRTAASALAGERGAVAAFVNFRGQPSRHRRLGLVPDCTLNDRYPGFPVKRPPLDVVLDPADPVPGTRHGLGDAPGLDRAIESWQRSLLATVQPPDRIHLDAATWTAEAHAYLSEPGPRAAWRRQAARLQPAFVPALATDPELRRLVDAGEPFEPRLRDLLRESLFPLGRPRGDGAAPSERITLGMVRRMRTLDRPLFKDGPYGIQVILQALCEIPPGIVPDSAAAWRRFISEGLYPLRSLASFDLPKERALRGIDAGWDLPPVRGLIDRDARRKALADLAIGLHDMAQSLAVSLLAPACADVLPEGLDVVTLAGHLLYRNDDLARMHRRQADWHAALPRLRPVIHDTGGPPWPALFAPFERDGIRIACLTTQAELQAEGDAGADGDGMAGLDHCVGGYAHPCREGRCHVASVRVAFPDGSYRRIATAEIVPTGDGFAIRQLRGRRNAEPPHAAAMAAGALVAALNAGAHPHDPAAARHRTAAAMPVRAGDLEACLAAWRPLLPRPLRVPDVEALRGLVRAWLGERHPLGHRPGRRAA